MRVDGSGKTVATVVRCFLFGCEVDAKHERLGKPGSRGQRARGVVRESECPGIVERRRNGGRGVELVQTAGNAENVIEQRRDGHAEGGLKEGLADDGYM